MSTAYINKKQRRFADIASMGEIVFHVSDLANLWNISNSNTLYTTLKRYTQAGLIHRIQKGMYSLIPPDDLDPLLLGVKAVHKYAYISTETVLFREGIINQKPKSVTIISSISKKFSIAGNFYISRQLNDRYLFNPEGIYKIDKIQTASVERAAADLLYFNPEAYFDAVNLMNWERISEIQKSLGYSCPRAEAAAGSIQQGAGSIQQGAVYDITRSK